MSDLRVEFEWLDPEGARGPELRATWSRLFLSVRGHPLTRVYDQKSQTVRDAIYAPLYPLAEWLAGNWWSLWHEVPRDASPVPEYESRHCLRYAREGFALPSLYIHPAGETVKVAWERTCLVHQGIEFVGDGLEWLNLAELRKQLSDLIQAVVERLSATGLAGTFLQQEWEAITSAEPEEAAFCAAAASLGLDPYALGDQERERIERVGAELPGDVRDEFFSAATLSLLERLQAGLVAAIDAAKQDTHDLGALKEARAFLCRPSPSPSSLPWNQGYVYAQMLRQHLGAGDRPLVSLEAIAEALRVPRDELRKAVVSVQDQPRPFAALYALNARESPAFVIRSRSPHTERFRFCRALCDYVAQPGGRASLVTEAATDRQKRNRAFAAEFLAPAGALKDRLQAQVATSEDLEELAAQFGVSTYVIAHQIDNHNIATLVLD